MTQDLTPDMLAEMSPARLRDEIVAAHQSGWIAGRDMLAPGASTADLRGAVLRDTEATGRVIACAFELARRCEPAMFDLADGGAQ
jgi:hypothetical protein